MLWPALGADLPGVRSGYKAGGRARGKAAPQVELPTAAATSSPVRGPGRWLGCPYIGPR